MPEPRVFFADMTFGYEHVRILPNREVHFRKEVGAYGIGPYGR